MGEKFLSIKGLRHVITLIKGLLAEKVDKDGDKQLSDENYTSEEKDKLDGISSGAQVNVIESVDVNGTAVDVSNKNISITFPTSLSGYTNDMNFQTDTEVASSIASAIGALTQFNLEVVNQLPAQGVEGTLYFIEIEGALNGNVCEEYMWINNRYERIGTTEMSLKDYVKGVDLVPIDDIERLWNGTEAAE